MDNKKIFLMVLIAAILAIFAVYFIFKIPTKSTPIKDRHLPEVAEPAYDETSVEESRDAEIVEENKQVQEVSADKSEKSTKKTEKKKEVTSKVETNEQTSEEKTVEEPKAAVELISPLEVSITETEEISKEVVVPVSYKTKNIYKYIYTPKRFRK